MILEERTYHIHTGNLAQVVRLYGEEGVPIQQEILGGLVGWFTVEVGQLSSIVTMWRYADAGERERRRAQLQADERWKAFLPKVQPMIHTQENRILVPTSFSPLQ